MITTTRTFTRPSIAVAWWHETGSDSMEFTQRLQNDFISTKKIISRVINNTDLSIAVIIQWVNKTAMNAHYNDPANVDYFARRDAYNAANGITTTFSQV